MATKWMDLFDFQLLENSVTSRSTCDVLLRLIYESNSPLNIARLNVCLDVRGRSFLLDSVGGLITFSPAQFAYKTDSMCVLFRRIGYGRADHHEQSHYDRDS